MSTEDAIFHPEIMIGSAWGRWDQKVLRIERLDGDGRAPAWFVGPTKNRNQASIHHAGRSIYFEIEDDGLSEEERDRRSALSLIESQEASGVEAELIFDSFNLDASGRRRGQAAPE